MAKFTNESTAAESEDYKRLYDNLIDENRKQQKLIQTLTDECNTLKTSLKESENNRELFRLMGETLPYGTWMCDSEGKALYMSQSFLDLLEMTLKEAQEFGWAHRLKPGTEARMFAKWLDCVRTGKDWDYEHIILGPDGKYHTVLTRGKPVKNEKGKITSWVGINLDIDERKNIEHDLICSKERFKILAQSANELLRTTDIQSSVQSICHNLMLHLNCQVFFNFINCGKDTLLLNAYEGIAQEEAEKIRYLEYGTAICGCVAKEGHKIVAEGIQTSSDERANLVRSYGVRAYASFPLLSEGGSIIGTLSFGTTERDSFNQSELSLINAVTDQVAIAMTRMNDQKMMREALSELEQSNKELEQFAYVASHDLQEPVRMLSAFSKLLARKYQGRLDEMADEYLNYITESARRMQSLITDLLSYARVSSKILPQAKADLNNIVEDVLKDLQFIITESGAEVTFDTLPAVPAEPLQIKQVFQNLIQNAIKFRQGNKCRVHISSEFVSDKWKLSVTDNGIGIDPEYFDKIFIIFQRLNERDKYPGTGIGLAICKKIIELHGGKIWVESVPGKGSSFHFLIPA